jgi:transcriptional regulator with XRE-family HTH domain
MKNFGEELKVFRESKNISLQDISKETRISVKFIEAIESGNLNILPQTYVRAFIKSYAKHVGLNIEETIAKYNKYIGNKISDIKTESEIEKTADNLKTEKSANLDQPSKTIDSNIKKTDETITSSKTTQAFREESNVTDNSKYTLQQKEYVKYVETPKINYIVLLSIIGLFAIILFVILRVPSEKPIKPTRVTIDTLIKEIEQKHEFEQSSPVSEPVTTPTYVRSDSLVLGILSDVDVWVSVRMDQTGADRGMITANNMKHVMAKERFTITATRGRQIKIYLNNNLLGNLSQTDSLRTAIVTLNGIVVLKPTVTEKPIQRTEDTELKPLEPVLP